jgi:hypothetical protein
MAAGVELISAGRSPTAVIAGALDAERAIPNELMLIAANAGQMAMYQERYRVGSEVFADFAVKAKGRGGLCPTPQGCDACAILPSATAAPAAARRCRAHQNGTPMLASSG